MSEKKSAILNVIRIVFSNLLTLMVGVLSSFIIPKVLTVDSYGYYKTFSLYISYCGLLHFGITNGVYLYFAGKNLEDLDKQKVHSTIFSIVLIELFLSFGLVLFSLFFPIGLNQKLVLVFVAIYNFVLQFESIQRNLLEATKCFKYESIVSVTRSLVTIAFIMMFWLANGILFEFSAAFYICCVISIASVCISLILYAIKLRRFIFAKGQTVKETKDDLSLFIKIGLPMMVCNLTGTLINSIDRQFVSVFFPIEQSSVFSEYSFAYSMLAFVTAATAAMTTVVYPYMKGKKTEKIVDFYPDFQKIVCVFVSVAFLSFFVFSIFIPWFLPKYIDSLPIFRVLLPNLALDVCVTVVMHNYFKFFKLENKFLVINISVLLLTIALDFVAYYAIIKNLNVPDPIWFSIASVLCGVVWYIVSQSFLTKKLSVKHWKNDLFLMITIVSFYFVSFGIESWWKGGLTYLLFSFLTILVFYGKDIFYIFKKIKKVKRAA